MTYSWVALAGAEEAVAPCALGPAPRPQVPRTYALLLFALPLCSFVSAPHHKSHGAAHGHIRVNLMLNTTQLHTADIQSQIYTCMSLCG